MSADAVATPASPEAMTSLILRIFRANGALLAAGDRLVADLGLTSARWQLLGAISDQGAPATVAQLARTIGVTRQAIQRIANDLAAEDVIVFRANPRHKRAPLLALTDGGEALFDRAMQRQQPWATRLGATVSAGRASDACDTLDSLVAAVEAMSPGD